MPREHQRWGCSASSSKMPSDAEDGRLSDAVKDRPSNGMTQSAPGGRYRDAKPFALGKRYQHTGTGLGVLHTRSAATG